MHVLDCFCLFAKVTDSRNKTELLVLFVYLTCPGDSANTSMIQFLWAINTLALYSCLQLNTNFVKTVKAIIATSIVEAFTIFMVCSLGIWAFSVIKLVLVLLLTLPIYLHVEQTGVSGLAEYCCARIDKRIKQLVNKEITRSREMFKEEDKKQLRQPTIPQSKSGDCRKTGIHRRTISQQRLSGINDDDYDRNGLRRAGPAGGSSAFSSCSKETGQRKKSIPKR